jgi:hypothetical protein
MTTAFRTVNGAAESRQLRTKSARAVRTVSFPFCARFNFADQDAKRSRAAKNGRETRKRS